MTGTMAGGPPGAVDDATRAQILASAPGDSVWVTANAGSGKTKVLTDRVARLLLAGAAPEKILCLTYTKAAAAEMQNRLFEMLGAWAMLGDDRLRAELAKLSEADARFDAPALDAQSLGVARKLFARALETPGGLKIQTIHAFCDALLRRFPLEAGVSPGFAVLDDRQKAQMIEAIRDRMALAAETGADMAFDAAADRLGEDGLDGLIAETLAKRAAFPADPAQGLRAVFGVPEGLDPAAIEASMADGLDGDALAALAGAAAIGGKRSQGFADKLRAGVAALAAGRPSAALDAVIGAALKADGGPYKAPWLLGKAVLAAAPWAAPAYEELAAIAAQIRDRRQALAAYEKSRDLHVFARALLDAYAAEKTRRGALDFEDLVNVAADLLTRSQMAAWALYKLDGGLSHLLIDEAQDTSPMQWTVIRAIADEFHAGLGAQGAEESPRTLFVVGDEKQSIYSFQGADPREFSRMRDYFATRLAAAGRGLQAGRLEHSFRSAPAVLGLVDAVFAGDAAQGLNADAAPPRHVAFRADAPGLVEIWPLFCKGEAVEPPHWADPVDAPAPGDPKARLAVAVAEHVDALLKEGAPIPDRKAGGWRALRPRDVLILVQRRDAIARGIIRALKRRGVDVAGEDRLLLTGELAVKDLLALIRVAVDAGDDLSLAAVLRSPLGGLGEADLFDLAHGREGGALWGALRESAGRFPEAAALIRDLRDRADFDRPYELFERALVRHGGRAKLLARLGGEAEDPIDELLAQALAYERLETPSLTGFLAWMEAAESHQIKREQGGGADEVRVMTVHGAKGLEAPFVILPDCGPRRASRMGRMIARLPCMAGSAHSEIAAWPPPTADAPEILRAAAEAVDARAAQERRRLLYVALTRAESRLLICGAGDPERLDGSWYDLVEQGMLAREALSLDPPEMIEGGAMLRLADRWGPEALRADDGGAPPAAAAPLRALDATAVAPPPAPPLARLGASDLTPEAQQPASDAGVERASGAGVGRASGAGVGRASGAGVGRDAARRRGDAIHLLLELLPEMPESARAARAAALLDADFADLPEPLRREAADEALAALALPEMADFLGPRALAEAGLSAEMPEIGARISGRVDRLLVGEDAVAALDFKTGAPAAGPDAAPEAYLRQMAAYRAILTRLHPGKTVRCGLFWTRAARIDWLSDAALDGAFARIGT